MADHSGWYPPGLVCYPPELPVSFRNIHDLKPIVGVPSDGEVIGIHTVMHVASKVSGVPGMHDPKFFMQLADHLFNVQMARYRSKYSLVTFPSDATYTPPALPTHISVNLEPVSGAPSDDEISKVHEAIQTYQELRRIPSLFDGRVNMELSQHLFDLQMARHMQIAGESQLRPVLQEEAELANPVHSAESAQTSTESINNTNNAGTGANNVHTHHTPQPAPGIDVLELMERSNQLAERFNQLLERSNELFSQVLERLTVLVEQPRQPVERSDPLAKRFNHLMEQSNEPAQRSNELAERSHELAQKSNQLMERLGQSFERSNELSEQTKSCWDRMGDVLGNINRVLVGVQHAIVRNHKGNTINALDCLVNENGRTPIEMCLSVRSTFRSFLENYSHIPQCRIPVLIDGVSRDCYIPDLWLGDFLQFYGIAEGLYRSPTSDMVESGMESQARDRLHDYFSAHFG